MGNGSDVKPNRGEPAYRSGQYQEHGDFAKVAVERDELRSVFHGDGGDQDVVTESGCLRSSGRQLSRISQRRLPRHIIKFHACRSRGVMPIVREIARRVSSHGSSEERGESAIRPSSFSPSFGRFDSRLPWTERYADRAEDRSKGAVSAPVSPGFWFGLTTEQSAPDPLQPPSRFRLWPETSSGHS